MNEKVSEIVLTGGPCGGKTSGLSRAQSWLMDRGFRVFMIPEVATMFITGGIQDVGEIAAHNPSLYLHIQERILGMQMAFKEHYRGLAAGFSGPMVILYDRGPMDGCAYVEESQFKNILDTSGWKLSAVRDYPEAVIHLVTAANGAEQYYTNVNNPARRESPEEARIVDQKTQHAWAGCPHLKVIGNDPPGFESKMKRMLAAIARTLGIPVPLEIERKFLLRGMPNLSDLGAYQPVKIEQIYLGSVHGEEVRIRRRIATDGSSIYCRTVKKPTGVAGVRNEYESTLTAREYGELAKFRQQGTRMIMKTRYCFLWENQYFELDKFINPLGRPFLEVELTERNDRITIPPFIHVEREVTGDPVFSNRALAQL